MTGGSDGDVVIVDDNPHNLTLLAGILREAGHRVRAANSGRRAIGIVQSLPPELIMLDVTMPEMDGYEVCRLLQETEAVREIPVIFISALSEPVDKVKAFASGGVDYVTKPFDAGEVLARVDVQLRLYRLQRELRQKNQELRELNEVKNRFLGTAAHDLRSPLSVVIGYSEVLLEDEPDALQKEGLGKILGTSRFMLRLVNDLLDHAAIEAGRLQLDRREVDLYDVLHRAVDLNRVLAGPKRIAVEFSAPPGSVMASADEGRLEQVLNNLVGNALKFSHPGTRIDVRLRVDPGEARVSVVDQGQGIPAAELGKLFEPFQRTSVKATGGEKSTGLGLAICRRIVGEHGGRLWAESEVGRGTSFHFTIPTAS